jgi:hypothetical protein
MGGCGLRHLLENHYPNATLVYTCPNGLRGGHPAGSAACHGAWPVWAGELHLVEQGRAVGASPEHRED